MIIAAVNMAFLTIYRREPARPDNHILTGLPGFDLVL